MDDRTALRALRRAPEVQVLDPLLVAATLKLPMAARVATRARALVRATRAAHTPGSNISEFLKEYGLATREGVALLCLAEALLRIPVRDSGCAHRRPHLGCGLALRSGSRRQPHGERVVVGIHVDGTGAGSRRSGRWWNFRGDPTNGAPDRRARDPVRLARGHATAGPSVRDGTNDRGSPRPRRDRQPMALQLRHAWRWDEAGGAARATVLECAADLIEAARAELLFLLAREAGRTLVDGISEVPRI
jgi:hypothetical protein